MNKNIFFLFFSILAYEISCLKSAAQITILSQNGGFEQGVPEYPIDQDQLNKCDYWKNSAGTCDWYTTNLFPNSLQGPCPYNGQSANGDIHAIKDATPKIVTFDGSDHYAGFGASEAFVNTLNNNIPQNSFVRLELWIALRYKIPIDINIDAILRGNVNDPYDRQVLLYKTIHPNELETCKWYPINTDWGKIESTTLKDLIIGGTDNPGGGDIFAFHIFILMALFYMIAFPYLPILL